MLLVNVTDVKSCWESLLKAPITINVTQLQDERHGADGCIKNLKRSRQHTTRGRGIEQKPRSTFPLPALLQQWQLDAGTGEFFSQSLGQFTG